MLMEWYDIQYWLTIPGKKSWFPFGKGKVFKSNEFGETWRALSDHESKRGGETTLLNALAGASEFASQDEILFDSKSSTADTRQKIGYVTQDDIFYSNLTVKQTLQVIARLRLSQDIQHFKKGISGGERKRTHTAEVLLIEPLILILDEPIYGLDSNTALTVNFIALLTNEDFGERELIRQKLIDAWEFAEAKICKSKKKFVIDNSNAAERKTFVHVIKDDVADVEAEFDVLPEVGKYPKTFVINFPSMCCRTCYILFLISNFAKRLLFPRFNGSAFLCFNLLELYYNVQCIGNIVFREVYFVKGMSFRCIQIYFIKEIAVKLLFDFIYPLILSIYIYW
eukprot:jgi/Galph1/1824/GphlegSOOS_G513.1